VPTLEWPELEGGLASLIAGVETCASLSQSHFVEWCAEDRHEVRAVAVEGMRPLRDASLERTCPTRLTC
jgi:hypothetical protein